MGSSKSKKKAQLERRARQRSARKGGVPVSAVAIAQGTNAWELKPKALADEPVHDVAVFARSSRDQLPAEQQVQATAVAEALELLRQGADAQALESLKDIPRASPFADWRLFVRGLAACYAGDISAARSAWERLDPARRPARIAAVLLKVEADTPLFAEGRQPPAKSIAAARQLRRREHILAAARSIASASSTNSQTTLSVAQAKQLIPFRDEYRGQDPEFVNRFGQACVRRAACQENSEVFHLLVSQVPGPAHDPHWNIENFKYAVHFADAEDWVDEAVDDYIEQDFGKDTAPEPVRRALLSKLRMAQAGYHLDQQNAGMNRFRFFTGQRIDYKEIEKLVDEAIKIYPADRNSHERLLELLQEQLDGARISTTEKKKIEKRVVAAKAAFVKAFPSEVETTLWLIDYYFDENKLSEADKLVSQLSSYRVEDPRAKVLPWKLSLRRAMYSSGRKTQLAQAPAALDEAAALWPGWLRQDWLPFLRAALALRQGDRAKFDELDAAARAACGASQLLGDNMTFAAVQQMNLPAPQLKPFRQIIEEHAAAADQIALDELFALGDFWWDLSRTGLRHKAYRLQAGKFGKVLTSRLKNGEAFQSGPHFEGACCWMAEHNFWHSGYDFKAPDWLAKYLGQHPRITAGLLKTAMRFRSSRWRMAEYRPMIERVDLAAKQERDPFYRHTMTATASDAKLRMADWEARERRSPFAALEAMLNDDDDVDDLDDGDFDNEEELCDCPKCRAARARAEAASGSAQQSGSQSARSLFADLEDDEDDEDDESYEGWEDGDGSPLSPEELFAAIGPPPEIMVKVAARFQQRGAEDQLEWLNDEIARTMEDPSRLDSLPTKAIELFEAQGLSGTDAAEFISATLSAVLRLAKAQSGWGGASAGPAPAAVNQTADQKRESRKARQKELNKKRKR